MKNPQKFTISARIQSFKYALNGLKILIKEEHNFRIHLLAAVLAIILGWYFQLSISEWLSLILVSGLVLITEIVNTVMENFSDFISPGQNKKIGKIKDMAAAAVLVAAIIALATGCLIFLPKLITLFL